MAGIVRVFTIETRRRSWLYRHPFGPAQHSTSISTVLAALSSNRSTAAVGGEFLWSVALSLPIRLGLCGKTKAGTRPMMANHQGGDSRKGQRNRQRHEVAGDAQAG